MRRTAINNYLPRALLVLLAAAVVAAGLLALGAKTAWAASRSFAPAQILAVGEASPTVTADFNGDGKADLAGPKSGADSVSVLLGNGDGTFQAEQDFAVGVRLGFATSADFNADNKIDLATANYSSSSVSVLLGNGDGSFQIAQNFALGTKPGHATSADFNGDNKADLAVNNQDSDNVSVLLGNGDGTFQGAQNFTVGDAPTHVTSADLNADNKVDLVTTNYYSKNISVLLGNGDGTFQGAQNFTAGLYPEQVVTADFNGDGKADLASANWGSGWTGGGSVSVLFGNGDGIFQDAQDVAVDGDQAIHPSSVTAADFDHDGNVDLAAPDENAFGDPSNALVLFGYGDGTFQEAQNFAVGENPRFVIGADLNADSYKDLAVVGNHKNYDPTTGYVAVLMNIPGPPEAPDTFITTGPDTPTKNTAASISFSSTENDATFECSLDSGAFESCSSPKEYTDLAEGSHTFEVRAINSAGTADATPASISWTVDTTTPTVTNTTPASAQTGVATNTNLTATFSEKMDPAPIMTSAFTLTKEGDSTPIGTLVWYDTATNKATLQPSTGLEPNVTYAATIKSGSSGAKDLAGNPLAQDYTWSFTTAPPPDTTAPTVKSLIATDKSSTGVPLRKTNFAATFSEKMDTTTLNTSTFKLYKCSSAKDTACTTRITAADAPVTPGADGLSATLNPYGTTSTLLAKNTKYKVVVTTGAKDLAGNALAQETVAFFTTGSS